MRVSAGCAECLYDKQRALTDDPEYLAEVRELIDSRSEEDTSPYLVYRFGQAYKKRFGTYASYEAVKKSYNDLVLSMEDSLRAKIKAAADPLATALMYARIGNYIDFGAMNHVDEATFLSLFGRADFSPRDRKTLDSFLSECEHCQRFLLITDNCGEIVLDKLFLEQLEKRFPGISVSVLVRGGEVLNDATVADALYVGMDQVAAVYSNGLPVGGTVLQMLPDDALQVIKAADVILAKGQGNYESLNGQGLHVFYSFLCKCALFTDRFQVPKLTGMFVAEA